MPEGDRYIKLLVAPELLELLFTRDEHGNRLSVDLGEPDREGFYVPTITTHFDDNLLDGKVTVTLENVKRS
jgi:hypothetical protein